MKKLIRILPPLACLLLAAGPALAAGDPQAGQTKSQPCQACHGANGMSVDPMYPNLAGQYASYLQQALTDYRDGTRKNPIMSGFAAALSDQDIADLAAWFSSQQGLQVISSN